MAYYECKLFKGNKKHNGKQMGKTRGGKKSFTKSIFLNIRNKTKFI